jgi:hypothetical protein
MLYFIQADDTLAIIVVRCAEQGYWVGEVIMIDPGAQSCQTRALFVVLSKV